MQPATPGLTQPLVFGCCGQLDPERPRRCPSPPSASMLAATGRSQLGAPGCSAAFRNHLRRAAGVPAPPVVDEPGVVRVLPLARASPGCLFEQRDRLIGVAGSVGIALREQDRAEPVRDVETRIQRRRDVEQRIQEIVVLVLVLGQLGAAVELDGANPVDIGPQVVEPERQTPHERRRANP